MSGLSDEDNGDCVTWDSKLPGGKLGGDSSARSSSPKTQMEEEKRMRRVIANSNERRRMQSINNGFNSLRNLLPHQEGEKLSKFSFLPGHGKTRSSCFLLDCSAARGRHGNRSPKSSFYACHVGACCFIVTLCLVRPPVWGPAG
ncbi:unnamed protein product [Notodromas monacha]|uniref:BHLH domain-containing protein n=1 Tax=Notodromas monacha TaxID=399045 RepID=A0A7R9BH17_9CRUS|nr:unnamed protein product [Notodromas monacha]CAG0914500.1 unnamed protein product [Notodromas monacha]